MLHSSTPPGVHAGMQSRITDNTLPTKTAHVGNYSGYFSLCGMRAMGKIQRNKNLLKEAFCPKGGSFQKINGIENMNMFRQDLQPVLFILSP